MSKTVIVFTTYYITPVKEDCVFNNKAVEKHVLTNEKIRKVFWDLLLADTDYLQNELINVVSDSEEIATFADDKRLGNSEVQRLLLKYSINPELDSDWSNTIQLKMLDDEEESSKIETIGEILNVQYSKKPVVSLSGKDSAWLMKHLKDDVPQKPFAIYNPGNYKEGPWLKNRFSYYKLLDSTRPTASGGTDTKNDTTIWAIWALHPNSVDEQTWLQALSEQVVELNDDVEDIFLILHNKDIGDSTFYVIESAKNVKINNKELLRTVAVFAHVDDIGRLLASEDVTVADIYDYIRDKCLGRDILHSISQRITEGDLQSAKTEIDSLSTIKPQFYQCLLPQIQDIIIESDKLKKAEKVYSILYDVSSFIKEFECPPEK